MEFCIYFHLYFLFSLFLERRQVDLFYLKHFKNTKKIEKMLRFQKSFQIQNHRVRFNIKHMYGHLQIYFLRKKNKNLKRFLVFFRKKIKLRFIMRFVLIRTH